MTLHGLLSQVLWPQMSGVIHFMTQKFITNYIMWLTVLIEMHWMQIKDSVT